MFYGENFKEIAISNPLDDLPERTKNHEVDTAAVTAVRQALAVSRGLLVQSVDENDYGADMTLEANYEVEGAFVIGSGVSVTNARATAQVKGTDKAANQDGSISISVDRTNLNYLLVKPHSLYICYHRISSRLLFKPAEMVFRELEARNPNWASQKTVTIRFENLFTDAEQQRLARLLWASARIARDTRLANQRPPNSQTSISVPNDAKTAKTLLSELRKTAQDDVISRYFDVFDAVLSDDKDASLKLRLSEVDLGINGWPFERSRVEEAREILTDGLLNEWLEPLTAKYSLGNVHAVLEERTEALMHYGYCFECIGHVIPNLAAMALKNAGAIHALDGDLEAAEAKYLRSIKLAPDLVETQLALASMEKQRGNWEAALKAIKRIHIRPSSAASSETVDLLRLECRFQLGQFEKAYDMLARLTSGSKVFEWVWNRCIGLMTQFGRADEGHYLPAYTFWLNAASAFPANKQCCYEISMLSILLRGCLPNRTVSFADVKESLEGRAFEDDRALALLWDRLGHWAQDDGNWLEAAQCYRQAYDLVGGNYGYCLGTALNFLGHFKESLPLFQEQIDGIQPDALSYFQLGVAKSGLGDKNGAIEAFKEAIILEPDYVLAWFNLGGGQIVAGDKAEGLSTWANALKLFPDHAEVERVEAFLTIHDLQLPMPDGS